ncbi:MAG: lysophospholipase [Cyanobacteria bacterium J06631_9]
MLSTLMTSIPLHFQEATQGTFSGARALKLFYQSWYPAANITATAVTEKGTDSAKQSPASSVKGVLTIVHGVGEHSGRYGAVVKGLTAAGYAVFGFDNQGHGKSEGQRGHINSWQDYRSNVRAFLQLVREKEPTAPLFLMGHSLGGLIVLDYVLRDAQTPEFESLDIQGVIVSAPPIQPCSGTASSSRIMLARLLSGVFPRFTLKMGIDGSGLSRDQTITENTEQDPLTHPYVTLRWGSETLTTLEWVKAHIDRLSLPILLTHGEADSVVSPLGTQQIFNQIKTPDKTLNVYPGSYHEPHNDLDAEQVVSDLVSWVERRNLTQACNMA